MSNGALNQDEKSADARINIRTKADLRQTIAYAAELSGLDLSNFMIASALERARTVIRENETLRISTVEDRAAFRAAMEAPGRQLPALAELLKMPPFIDAAKR